MINIIGFIKKIHNTLNLSHVILRITAINVTLYYVTKMELRLPRNFLSTLQTIFEYFCKALISKRFVVVVLFPRSFRKNKSDTICVYAHSFNNAVRRHVRVCF